MSLQSVSSRIAYIQNRIGQNSNAHQRSEFEGLLSDVQRHAGVSPNDAEPVASNSVDGAANFSAALLQIQQGDLMSQLNDGSATGLGSVASGVLELKDLLGLVDELGIQSVQGDTGAVAGGSPSGTGIGASVIDGYEIGSGYGMRVHPITGSERMHSGVDIGAPTGTPVRSFSDGVVTFAGERGGYGNLVVVDHGNGYESRYAHQSELGVEVGDTVGSGQMLGLVGSTGQSTGPHLHFELRQNGESLDPTELLKATGMSKRGETQ